MRIGEVNDLTLTFHGTSENQKPMHYESGPRSYNKFTLPKLWTFDKDKELRRKFTGVTALHERLPAISFPTHRAMKKQNWFEKLFHSCIKYWLFPICYWYHF